MAHSVAAMRHTPIVYGKTELVISPVIYLILSERDVAHGEVIRTIKKQPFSDTDTYELFGMLCTKCLICRNIRRKLTTLICNSCEDSRNRFGSVFRIVIALAGG